MSRKFDLDMTDDLYEDDEEVVEFHFRHDKRRRSFDARREIERRMEVKRLRKLLDCDDYPDFD
jgi:hypothetical protein